MEFGIIRDSALLVIMFMFFGMPALALSARIALKPITEALVRLRDVSATHDPLVSDPRLAAVESEVSRLRAEVQRLSEAEAFTRQLMQGGSPKLHSE